MSTIVEQVLVPSIKQLQSLDAHDTTNWDLVIVSGFFRYIPTPCLPSLFHFRVPTNSVACCCILSLSLPLPPSLARSLSLSLPLSLSPSLPPSVPPSSSPTSTSTPTPSPSPPLHHHHHHHHHRHHHHHHHHHHRHHHHPSALGVCTGVCLSYPHILLLHVAKSCLFKEA